MPPSQEIAGLNKVMVVGNPSIPMEYFLDLRPLRYLEHFFTKRFGPCFQGIFKNPRLSSERGIPRGHQFNGSPIEKMLVQGGG